jgi:gamma-glutamylcyclotransferase (GGCT)/AIG2-like uncharacterized protein YtfP
MKYRLFVYGTLLEERNVLHRLLELFKVDSFNATFGGKMYTQGFFPYVVPSNELGDIVLGKVYVLDDERILELIDEYEGYVEDCSYNLYDRRFVTVYVYEREIDCECFTYLLRDGSEIINGLEVVKDGNWLKYMEGKYVKASDNTENIVDKAD